MIVRSTILTIFEGKRAIGTTQSGLISKNNIIIIFFLNVQSIAEKPQNYHPSLLILFSFI
ncbi:hypothetical protein AVDCRST_MAG84-5292 [uncultured Microcoleus sp.]|uniref:Uncharacterized protein n=1 Tax=uncultured Microcoleus sp. TaxID=259945 RepID=A0A6J4NEA8_9CYAN|nr:hypothetical protein AVDCRST_MAG84-5292 [uncultured Microcoleus sp.]